MAKEELFDVITYKIKDGKRGTTIVRTIEPVSMEEAEKKVAEIKRRGIDYGIIHIVPDMGLP